MSTKTAKIQETTTESNAEGTNNLKKNKHTGHYQKPEVGFYIESENNNSTNIETDSSMKITGITHQGSILKHWHLIALYLVVYDIIAISVGYFFALWMRYDCKYSLIPSDSFAA